MKKRMLLNREVPASKFLLFGVLGLIICFVFVSCENYQILSQWKDKHIVVDGESEDWLDALTYVEEFNISLGMANDSEFLYLCAVVENPLVRMRVMQQGLTVWFDPNGRRDKTLGIRFPLGSLESEGLLEILGPNREDVRRINKNDAKGVNVALGVSSGLLVYELKVPLINNPEQPFAINVRPGNPFGVGIETSAQHRDMEKISRSRATGGIGRPEGGGNSGMGRPGSIGGIPGAGPSLMPKKLKLWLSVLLSQEKGPF